MAEPEQRRTNADGGKFYEHPSRTEEIPGPAGSTIVRPATYISVTQVLQQRNKPALVFWAANLAARRAMDNLPKLLAAALVDDCGRAAARTEPYGCKECEACIERWVSLFHVGEKERRAREGTCAHDVLERWILTGEWSYTPVTTGDPAVDQYVPTPEAMAPYITALQTFVADYGLTPEDFLVAECTVWNHRLRYAGTLDFIVNVEPRTKKAAEFCVRINYAAHLQANVRINALGAEAVPEELAAGITAADLARPVRILGDAKTTEGAAPKLYSEYTLQLTGYRNAETMTPKHAAPEMERPMAETDGAAILQLRYDPETGKPAYTFRPVVTDGHAMRAFEAVIVDARWEAEFGDKSNQVGSFPLPGGWTWQPPTFERATTPDGKLCGCAACDNPNDPDCLFAGRASRPPGLHVREVTADGDPAPPKKRAPAKRAAKKATPAKAAAPAARKPSPLADLSKSMGMGVWPETPDDDIPF